MAANFAANAAALTLALSAPRVIHH